jgi:hypothetical protein
VVEGFAGLEGALEALEDVLGEALLHDALVEDVDAVEAVDDLARGAAAVRAVGGRAVEGLCRTLEGVARHDGNSLRGRVRENGRKGPVGPEGVKRDAVLWRSGGRMQVSRNPLKHTPIGRVPGLRRGDAADFHQGLSRPAGVLRPRGLGLIVG